MYLIVGAGTVAATLGMQHYQVRRHLVVRAVFFYFLDHEVVHFRFILCGIHSISAIILIGRMDRHGCKQVESVLCR